MVEVEFELDEDEEEFEEGLPLTRWAITSRRARFPLPFDPRMAIISPEWTSKETSFRSSPEGVLPVRRDQREGCRLVDGRMGPEWETAMSSRT